jgi:hypothetical protein
MAEAISLMEMLRFANVHSNMKETFANIVKIIYYINIRYSYKKIITLYFYDLVNTCYYNPCSNGTTCYSNGDSTYYCIGIAIIFFNEIKLNEISNFLF